MREERERGLLPPPPKRKKPWAVLSRCVGGSPRSWHNWSVWRRYRTLKEAQQAVRALNYKWNAMGLSWKWEFKLAP